MATSEGGPLVGFISPPRWYDPAPHDFQVLCGPDVRVQQIILPFYDFDYRLESVAGEAVQDTLNVAARTLAAAGCELIVQVGVPFAWAGLDTEGDARRRRDALADAAGVPVVMTGLAVIDALRAMSAERVVLACTYYDTSWREAWRAFVTACGFQVMHAETLADQGLAPAETVFEDYAFSMGTELTEASISIASRKAPVADAVVVTGVGARTLWLAPVLEMALDRALVGADTATHWVAGQYVGQPLGHQIGALGHFKLPGDATVAGNGA